jgi:hypothetical protein
MKLGNARYALLIDPHSVDAETDTEVLLAQLRKLNAVHELVAGRLASPDYPNQLESDDVALLAELAFLEGWFIKHIEALMEVAKTKPPAPVVPIKRARKPRAS